MFIIPYKDWREAPLREGQDLACSLGLAALSQRLDFEHPLKPPMLQAALFALR
jgi:hypothetical protein